MSEKTDAVTGGNKMPEKKINEKERAAQERKERLRKQITEQLNDYVLITSKKQYEDLECKKLNTWVVDGNGVFCVRKNDIGEFTAKISSIAPIGLPKVVEECYRLLVPRIPAEIYYQMQNFFIDICEDMDEAEAFIQTYYDKVNKCYVNHVPHQKVSKGSVKYDAEENLSNKDPDRYKLVLESHSHNTMGSFFSGVDDNDEKETRLYGVFGKIKDKHPSYSIRFVVNDSKPEVDERDVFLFQDVGGEYPEEWKEKVKKTNETTGVAHLDGTTRYYGSSYWQNYRYGNYQYGGHTSAIQQKPKQAGWALWDGKGLPEHVQKIVNSWTMKQGEKHPELIKKLLEKPKTNTSVMTQKEYLDKYPSAWDPDSYPVSDELHPKTETSTVDDSVWGYPGQDDESISRGELVSQRESVDDPWSTESMRDSTQELDDSESLEDRWQIIGDFVSAMYDFDVQILCDQLEEYGFADDIIKKLTRKVA